MEYTPEMRAADYAVRTRAEQLIGHGHAPSFDAQLQTWGASVRWIDTQIEQIDELITLLDVADKVEESGS